MTDPLFLVTPGDLSHLALGDEFVLGGPEGRHAARVRRITVGENLQVADGRGWLARGTAHQVDADSVTLRVDAVELIAAPSPRFVLVQALAKGERDDQAIEAATELGVDEVIPWQAERSIVRWRGERGEKAWHKWGSVLTAATKQSRRARRPDLGPLMSTHEVAERIRACAAAYILDEDATLPLAGQELPKAGDIAIIVGPEGGIAPAERERFVAAGGVLVRLGETVLRSSSAGPAGLAVLNAATRWR